MRPTRDGGDRSRTAKKGIQCRATWVPLLNVAKLHRRRRRKASRSRIAALQARARHRRPGRPGGAPEETARAGTRCTSSRAMISGSAASIRSARARTPSGMPLSIFAMMDSVMARRPASVRCRKSRPAVQAVGRGAKNHARVRDRCQKVVWRESKNDSASITYCEGELR
jgi:hypothetical protein